MNRSRTAARVGAEVGGTAVIITALWIYTNSAHSFYVPTIKSVLVEFRRNWLFSRFTSDVVPSMVRLAVGLSCSIVCGLAIGLLLARYRRARLMAKPIMTFLLNMPPPALLPIFIVFLGIGNLMKIVVIFSLCIWPMLYNTLEGVLEMDPTVISTTSIYRITGWARLRSVLLPAISPRLFAGLRISLSSGLLILIVSEMVASTNGIGYFVLQSQTGYEIPAMWSGILLLGLLGYLFNGGATLWEKRALKWHQSHREAES